MVAACSGSETEKMEDSCGLTTTSYWGEAGELILLIDKANKERAPEEKILQDLLEQLKATLDESVPKILLGNKLDLKPHLSPSEEEKV